MGDIIINRFGHTGFSEEELPATRPALQVTPWMKGGSIL